MANDTPIPNGPVRMSIRGRPHFISTYEGAVDLALKELDREGANIDMWQQIQRALQDAIESDDQDARRSALQSFMTAAKGLPR